MAIPDKVKEYKYNAAKKDWQVATDIFKAAQENGELKKDFSPEILARNFIGNVIVLLTEYIMDHLNRDEFESQLSSLLNFWKKQFVIETN